MNDSDVLTILGNAAEQAEEYAGALTETIWEAYEYMQTELEATNEDVITTTILEFMRYCRTVGLTKRDMRLIFKAGLEDFDKLTPPPGVMMGDEAEVSAIELLNQKSNTTKIRPWTQKKK